MQWDEKEWTPRLPQVYFWTPNSEILAEALVYKILTNFSQ